MITSHAIYFTDATTMTAVKSSSVDLIVTSPPYPMIEMWDQTYQAQNPNIASALSGGAAMEAFELMHNVLDPIWKEAYRVLKSGGFACINIGDATRTVNDEFYLFPNHARILSAMLGIGFKPLPLIIWRKQTNAPNKFMGSGVLPAGAYVTLEHEYVLILRKGSKRQFQRGPDADNRRQSAIFWDERNHWFSDVWFDLKGATQKMAKSASRSRSGAFPFELPYRLINMYSSIGDTVLDPFLGSGSTACAAVACARNSIGVEIDPTFKEAIYENLENSIQIGADRLNQRLRDYGDFLANRLAAEKPIKHRHQVDGYPVITRQETGQTFYRPREIWSVDEWEFEVEYDPLASDLFPENLAEFVNYPPEK